MFLGKIKRATRKFYNNINEKYSPDDSETVKRYEYHFSEEVLNKPVIKKYNAVFIQDVSAPFDFSDNMNDLSIKGAIKPEDDIKLYHGAFVTPNAVFMI